MERLDKLCVYVPAMVVKEVRDNFQREYRLGKEFFRLIVQGGSVTIMWTDGSGLNILSLRTGIFWSGRR